MFSIIKDTVWVIYETSSGLSFISAMVFLVILGLMFIIGLFATVVRIYDEKLSFFSDFDRDDLIGIITLFGFLPIGLLIILIFAGGINAYKVAKTANAQDWLALTELIKNENEYASLLMWKKNIRPSSLDAKIKFYRDIAYKGLYQGPDIDAQIYFLLDREYDAFRFNKV